MSTMTALIVYFLLSRIVMFIVFGLYADIHPSFGGVMEALFQDEPPLLLFGLMAELFLFLIAFIVVFGGLMYLPVLLGTKLRSVFSNTGSTSYTPQEVQILRTMPTPSFPHEDETPVSPLRVVDPDQDSR